MIIPDEVRDAVGGTAFVPLITMNADGTPHPIIAGKGEADGENIVFGIYKMEQTQKNLLHNNSAWVMAATMNSKPVGYRICGTASSDGKKLTFHAEKIEKLI